MPLDPQALLACQAAMHCVPVRDNMYYARAAIQLPEDGNSIAMGASKGSEDEAEVEWTAKVRPMRLGDVPTVVRTVLDDDTHDPLKRYMVNTPDFKPTCITRFVNYLSVFIMYTLWVILGMGWVIDGERAFMIAKLQAPKERTQPSLLVKWFTKLYWKVNGPFGFIFTREQRKRVAEHNAARITSTRLALGTHHTTTKEMLTTIVLMAGTEPQRKALVSLATAEADRQNHATCLYSSNHFTDLDFHGDIGFTTAGTYEVGQESPSPVVVGIMVREPRTTVYSDAKVANLV